MFAVVRHLGRGRTAIESLTRSEWVAEQVVARILAAEPHACLSVVRRAA